jgi:short-subunit dehydrogenase
VERTVSVDWRRAVVVVTGATGGIGRAVVDLVAARGALVAAVARHADDLRRLEADARHGGRVIGFPADVGHRAEIGGVIQAVEDRLGPVDVLVNNAGVGHYGALIELDLDAGDAERLLQVNTLGAVYATRAVLPGMVRRRRGHIVMVASIAGRVGAPFEAVYSASKFAVVGLSEALAVEVAPLGVRVCVVDPGPVDTGFFAARGHPYGRSRPRPVAPERVAAAVVRAVERDLPHVLVPRSLRLAVLARHVAPSFTRWATGVAFRSELTALAARVGGGETDPARSAPEVPGARIPGVVERAVDRSDQ